VFPGRGCDSRPDFLPLFLAKNVPGNACGRDTKGVNYIHHTTGTGERKGCATRMT